MASAVPQRSHRGALRLGSPEESELHDSVNQKAPSPVQACGTALNMPQNLLTQPNGRQGPPLDQHPAVRSPPRDTAPTAPTGSAQQNVHLAIVAFSDECEELELTSQPLARALEMPLTTCTPVRPTFLHHAAARPSRFSFTDSSSGGSGTGSQQGAPQTLQHAHQQARWKQLTRQQAAEALQAAALGAVAEAGAAQGPSKASPIEGAAPLAPSRSTVMAEYNSLLAQEDLPVHCSQPTIAEGSSVGSTHPSAAGGSARPPPVPAAAASAAAAAAASTPEQPKVRLISMTEALLKAKLTQQQAAAGSRLPLNFDSYVGKPMPIQQFFGLLALQRQQQAAAHSQAPPGAVPSSTPKTALTSAQQPPDRPKQPQALQQRLPPPTISPAWIRANMTARWVQTHAESAPAPAAEDTQQAALAAEHSQQAA